MNFKKNYSNYKENAIVQKYVSKELITLLEDNTSYKSILELGVGTGFFTNILLENFPTTILDINDIFDTTQYFQHIQYRNFIQSNMESYSFKKYSLVASSSSFQWIKNLFLFLKKISFSCEELLFSIYVTDNLKEIKNHFDITLKYHSKVEIHEFLNSLYYNVISKEEEIILEFETPFLALKHLKNTGVTGFKKSNYIKIKEFKDTKLTYKVAYFFCKNKI